jgi:hypothetical protein
MPLRRLWKRVQSQFLPRPRGVKAWGRRLAVFTLERGLEAVFFGVLLIGTGWVFAWIASVQAGDGGQSFYDGMSRLFERPNAILNLLGVILVPMLFFHLLSWYFLSCILFGLIFRSARPLRQGLIFMGAGAVHVVVMFLREGGGMPTFIYVDILWGLLSVFSASYLGASLLQRWDAAANRKALLSPNQ